MTAILLCAVALGASAQDNAAAKQPPPAQAAGVVAAVKIEPSQVTVAPGESRQFTAAVAGNGAFSSEVKWSVNDVDGGNAALGTISSSGLYVTPYPTPAQVVLKATSAADGTKSASATITFAAPPVAAGPALQVDVTAATHPISPLIYGMNFWRLSDPNHEAPKVAQEVRLPLDRWGGDGYTLYNYKLDVSDLGDDWFFEIAPNANRSYPDQSDFNSQVIGDRAVGAKTILQVNLIGWVAKTRTRGSSFSVAKYGPQQKTDPYWHDFGNGIKPDGTRITNNDPNDICMPVDESWTADWVKYLVGKFGTAANGGVAIYALDNEPTWWDRMHFDVHPLPFTYDEITEKGLKVARAVKAADPTAEVSGPVIDFWITYFYSQKDIEWVQEHWPNLPSAPPDYLAHGNVPLMDYYLRAFKTAQEADPHHTRLLDYLDLHAYFATEGAMLKPAGTSVRQRTVIDSTRALWDPTYTAPNFADPDGSAKSVAPAIIPRMKKWIAADYPGTKTAITEYNWGAPEHISGAVAQADILGIFGREGLDLGTLWGPPDLNQPLMFAFKMFRNYDDHGAGFGDTSVHVISADQSKVSIYAARRATDHTVTVVVINKTFGDLRTDMQIEHFKTKEKIRVYRYSSADLAAIDSLPDVEASKSGKKDKASVVKDQLFPAMSITLYEVHGK